MLFQTYSQIISKLQNDLDIGDGIWVTQTELLGLLNEGIGDAETLVHQLHHEDKYFLVNAPLTLIAGTATYALPTDIVGMKLRQLFYNNGSDQYEVNRIRNLLEIPFIQPGDRYQYMLTNSQLPTGIQINIYPPPVDAGPLITQWYVRHARQFTSNTADANNVLEIPEAGNFIYQHVRRSVARKAKRADWVAREEASTVEQYSLLADMLKEMTVDGNTLVPMDLTSYYNQELTHY